MKAGKYFILSMNPGFDQWHIVHKEPAVQGVFRADEVLRIVSGKGLNVARVLNNMGYYDYVCVNILGGSVGEIISEQCREEGLNCLNYHIASESRINTCVMLEYKKETVSYNDPGPVLLKEEVSGFQEFLIDRLPNQLGSAVLSGAPSRGISERDYRDILDTVLKCGHELIVDVSGRWLEIASEYPLKLLKVNREEFKEAFQLDAFLFIENLKRFKNERRIQTLIVTDGKNGCIAYGENQECYWCRAENIESGSFSVGSGDTFLGGYLIKMASGENLKTCLEYAAACGLSNTYQYGPAMIHNIEVEKLINYMSVIPVTVK